MKFLRTTLLPLSLLGVSLSLSNSVLADGGIEFTSYPAGMCRAAVEAQDKNLRVFNNRYKNIGSRATYIVCPVPTNFDTGDLADLYNELLVGMDFLNEGSNVASFSCTLYGFDADHSLAPAWFSSNQLTIGAGQYGWSYTEATGTINFAGYSQRSANDFFQFTAVCLLPPGVSITGYEVVQSPL